jgi:hypothetical protein
MPAQAADHAGSLRDEIFAVVDEQAHLAVLAVESGNRQIGLPECCASDRQGVDRVGLPERAGAVSRVGHQLRRHSQDPFAGGAQVTLQAPREVPAVLDCPQPEVSVLCRPGKQLQMVTRGRPGCRLRQLPTLLVDCDDGVAALDTPLLSSHAGRSQDRRGGRTTDTSHEGN